MLFNSFLYILIFLPGVVTSYFLISKHINYRSAKMFLAAVSLLFYGWWKPIYLVLLCFSILINYSFSWCIDQFPLRKKKLVGAGIIFNLSLLGYFKYANFFIDNMNLVSGTHLLLAKITLPLGISFFTFTQIAYLIDRYRGLARHESLLNYALFVSYFPHLLAGPVIHHAQIMPQFNQAKNGLIHYKNIYLGLILFFIGLFKKNIIADSFAIFANQGFSQVDTLSTTMAWVTTLAYTFQIYFDFSGYTDMALGASRLLNIDLPINFNSPYQAANIQDFWRRWHITLSHFLRDYLYIPLGGNRVSELKTYRNLLLTFILGGLWHGAGWNYIFWGFLHGSALSVHRLFLKTRIYVPQLIGLFITFNFVNITWIFFRASSIKDAMLLISKMFGFMDLTALNPAYGLLLGAAMIIAFKAPNSQQLMNKELTQRFTLIPLLSIVMLLSIFSIEISDSHAFIYYQF